ncbi:hypothetical protein JCM33374_g2197 [Metschnikowia sp. JCM 33374]|nr:hypothetical protein JCM33374_g2197 [Metschnikowia sp. JCM 33374]
MIDLLLILSYIQLSAALALNLCSSTNLGSDSTSNQFMSNGYCRNYCSAAGFNVAITQSYQCWCSNTVPADTVDSSLCNIGCPGYSEQERCGGSGVYGYVVFGGASTVTKSTSSSSSSSSSSPSPVVDTSTANGNSNTNANTAATGKTGATTSPTASTFSTATPTTIPLISVSSTSALHPTTSVSSTSISSAPTQTSSATAAESQNTSNLESLSAVSSTSPPAASSPSSPLVSISATTILSVVTLNGAVTQQVSTRYITATQSVSSASESAAFPPPENKKSFFDSSAKVAGTFTAVGVVAVALVATLLYCCCFAAAGGKDEYSDEEQQYSSDDNSFMNKTAVLPGGELGEKSRTPSQSNLNRNGSGRSIRTILNAISPGSGGGASSPMSRSHSRKKLNPKNESVDTTGPIMSPISEFDNVLDPRAMFEDYNSSKISLNDENDYSRRIWHVTNPE